MTYTHPMGLGQGHGVWQNLSTRRLNLPLPIHLGVTQALLPTQLTWEASGFALGSKILSCLSWKSKEEAIRVQLGWDESLGASLSPGSQALMVPLLTLQAGIQHQETPP